MNKEQRPIDQFIKYSAIATQMAATIGIFTYIGFLIDKKVKLEKPWYTILLSIIGVFAGLYLALKDFLKQK